MSAAHVIASPPHPLLRRFRAEQLVRLRRADEQERYAVSQRQGRIDPNPHQIDAVIFALSRIPQGGCILADEVGLGKTIEAGLVIAQLIAEGSASRVLIILPKPLLGQWQDELYRLFGIQAVEIDLAKPLTANGVFLVGREIAGSERGSSALADASPFDLCVIDEAHEIFAGIYRRFDRHGLYRSDAAEAQLAHRVRGFLGPTPVLLLTATPIQNNLAELWSLVQYVEPTGTLLGNLRTFRDIFCTGDDRTLAPGQADELKRRIETVVQRTLRRQAQEFLERPFVSRRARIFEYAMTAEERALYNDVTAYLLDPNILAFRGSQRRLLLIGFHRRMASSIAALAHSLRRVADRLSGLAQGLSPDVLRADDLLQDLEDESTTDEDGVSSDAPADRQMAARELARVRDFISRAESLPQDSKAEKLLEVLTVIRERAPDRRRVVIFTESLRTQEYLEELLIRRGGLDPEKITLFRGSNDSPRAREALDRWQREVGEGLPAYQRPSQAVAVRLALVHEFKTRSEVFISTEAGAKGLNLQFCDTLINYDLPWNPQRIEQRIGRCHRYSQGHDVTVVNFLASDNEAQRLTLEILSRKLDLFGEILDASDVVLHQPSTEAPEALAGAVGAGFETELRRIYERARTVEEIESELRELRSRIEDERKNYEQTWERTAGLIETRFDDRVRDVFRRLRQTLPESLGQLDRSIEQLVTGFLDAAGVPYVRTARDGRVQLRVPPSDALPGDLSEGGLFQVGRADNDEEAAALNLGHPLVSAAVDEARSAAAGRLRVQWTLGASAPSELGAFQGSNGRLVVARVRYDGFEKVDRLVTAAVLVGRTTGLSSESLRWLLDQSPEDAAEIESDSELEELLEDALEEALFLDQLEASKLDQERFQRHLEQVESYVEDQLLALRRRIDSVRAGLQSAEDQRDAALGSEARTRAEARVSRSQAELDGLEAERFRLEARDDDSYRRWRDQAHQKRYHAPGVERILEVEFSLA